MFHEALAKEFSEVAEIVAFCDLNPGRMELANKRIAEHGHPEVPLYKAEDFDRMVEETRPDVVIVTTKDSFHSDYICRALELGCDAITEKPMTIDEDRCRQILHAVDKSQNNLTVTFNYRYAPPREQIKELIMNGEIGEVLSVDFAWMLDTRHGADYFRRWHAERENSGSLLVHKSTHHFDLVNWWIDDLPEEVFCHGTNRYYTPERAEQLGLGDHAPRCLDCPCKDRCNFFLDIRENETQRELYLENEQYDGYIRDRCVFDPRVNIWDTMSVNVRYRGGCLLNYILHAYSPYEGYRIAFNGTKGRLEHWACERTYVSGDGTVPGELEEKATGTTLIREFSKPEQLKVRTGTGGHGGGDPKLLDHLFSPDPAPDTYKQRAGEVDGAYSILIGVAGYHSIDSGKPVKIAELLADAPIRSK
jgi:predicted dehydrogenase